MVHELLKCTDPLKAMDGYLEITSLFEKEKLECPNIFLLKITDITSHKGTSIIYVFFSGDLEWFLLTFVDTFIFISLPKFVIKQEARSNQE